MTHLTNPRRLLMAAAIGLTALQPAFGDGGRLMPRDALPLYAQECGSCHTAYAPGLLPAASWSRLMSGLGRHYGSDASLDPAVAGQLGHWLQANAGTYKRVNEEPPQDRITLSAWFERKHRKVDAVTWTLASVKSAANCGACHSGADQGSFNEGGLRQPAGLSARSARAWND
jgi:Dihaem cytochrome c